MKLKTSGFGSTCRRAALAAVLLPLFVASANAQTVEARCEKLLPLKTLTAAIGAGYTAYDAVERKPGQLECSWLSRGNGSIKTLIATHWNKAALAEWGREFTPAKTVNNWWDMVVTNSEEAMKGKRQLITGLGKRAALIAMPASKTGSQTKILIQRDNEVIDVISTGLSNAEITKAAKALASP
ncbi:MAG: hypothetical protein ABIZ64_06230 [Casimicrobium sp.]